MSCIHGTYHIYIMFGDKAMRGVDFKGLVTMVLIVKYKGFKEVVVLTSKIKMVSVLEPLFYSGIYFKVFVDDITNC